MNLTSIARSVLILPLVVALSCAEKKRENLIPPASIGPVLNNDTVPPLMATNAGGTLGVIQRFDPAVDALLPPNAKVEILAANISWAEGPVWFKGGLLFSDIPQNTVYRWTPEDGITVYLKPSGYTGETPRGGEPGSNALTVDHEGRLTLCQHGDRRVIRIEPDSRTVTVLADKYKGMRFSSPNDLCYDSKGNLYFTDPPYGLEKRDEDPKKEMDKNSVYLHRPDGEVIRLDIGDIVYADGKHVPLNFPNGVALSPDEKSLYLCVSDPMNPVYMKYDVQPDGTIAHGRIFFDTLDLLAKGQPGLPDGVKLDMQGNLWACGPGGVLIITPEGKHIGTIRTNVKTANCGWGDDGCTLYLCADHNLCRIRTLAKGIIPGPKPAPAKE